MLLGALFWLGTMSGGYSSIVTVKAFRKIALPGRVEHATIPRHPEVALAINAGRDSPIESDFLGDTVFPRRHEAVVRELRQIDTFAVRVHTIDHY